MIDKDPRNWFSGADDIALECAVCFRAFLFTVGEQTFYRDRDLVPPRRCKDCRRVRKIMAIPQDRSE